jgi:hypothetical protein
LPARIHGCLAAQVFALALGCACGSAVWGQDRVADLRSRFSHESDPVRKAKLMPDLGNAEFREIESDLLAERLPDALTVLQQYRDEAQSCVKNLDAKNVDAEQHPAGFKQLEFSLRESLRRLDDLLVTLTRDDQAPFQAARNDIDDMNRHLIHELFPRQPSTDAPNPKPKG